MVTTTTKKRRDIMDIERRYRKAWAEKEYKAIESFIEKERARERDSHITQPWIDEWIKFEYEGLFTFSVYWNTFIFERRKIKWLL